MKKITKTETNTQESVQYVAVDGTVFEREKDCIEYEKTAKCAIKLILKPFTTEIINSQDLFHIDDGFDIYGITFPDMNIVEKFTQYMILRHPFLLNIEYKDRLEKLYNQIKKAYDTNSMLLIGYPIDEEEDIFIIDTRENIINSLNSLNVIK